MSFLAVGLLTVPEGISRARELRCDVVTAALSGLLACRVRFSVEYILFSAQFIDGVQLNPER